VGQGGRQTGRGDRRGKTERGTDREGVKTSNKQGGVQGGGTDREGIQTGRGDRHTGGGGTRCCLWGHLCLWVLIVRRWKVAVTWGGHRCPLVACHCLFALESGGGGHSFHAVVGGWWWGRGVVSGGGSRIGVLLFVGGGSGSSTLGCHLLGVLLFVGGDTGLSFVGAGWPSFADGGWSFLGGMIVCGWQMVVVVV
jgi:hypothetical protein